MKDLKLDKYEKDLLQSYEKGEWRSRKPTKAELRRWAASARATLKKDQRINIRISRQDLQGLQAKAAEEGLPYQTLISSILHKYVSGRLAST